MKDATRLCLHCEAVFTPRVAHQKFCSTDCRHAAWNESRRSADYVPVVVGGPGTCERCGAEFVVTQPSKRFCSERCRKRAEEQRRARRRGVKPRRAGKPRKPPVGFTRSCASPPCEEVFTTRRSYQKYCSPRCSRRARNRRQREARQDWPCAAEGCERPGVNSSQLCDMHFRRRQRGIPFDQPVYGSGPKTCTVEGCSNRTYWLKMCRRHYRLFHAANGADWAAVELESSNNKAKTELYGGEWSHVNRVEVFERDGWVCQLCGERVDPLLKGPDPLAASLDHIVPVSLGGDHLPENCQLAHLGCNSSKGARWEV